VIPVVPDTFARMTDCLFCKMVTREIQSDEVHRSDDFLAFLDLNPQAPTHILVIPTRHFSNAADLAAADQSLAGGLIETATRVSESQGLESGYRIVINTGPDGGQSVFHVHAHVLGGRTMSWPPG